MALARADALGRGAIRVGAARAHFDDDDVPIVAADEIELAQAAAVAARDDPEPLFLEIRGCARLPESAARKVHSALADEAARFDARRNHLVGDGTAVAELSERQHAPNAPLRVER